MTQSICASLSAPLSRFVAMTSTAEKPSAKGKVLASECQRQHVGHRLDALRGVDEEIRAAVLPQQLPAPSTRHQHLTVEVDARERDQATAAGGVQRGHQP